MKWFILTCLIIVTKLTESRNVFKRDSDHLHRKIAEVHQEIGEEFFKAITLVLLAQNFQKCSLEEHLPVVEKINNFAKHCEQDPADEECGKPLATLLHNAMCAIPTINEHYQWTVDCCEKADPDRGKCFIEHRHVALESYKRPTSEEVCKEFKEHPQTLIYRYIVEFSKRNSNMYCPAILGLSQDYQRIMSACCEAEDRDQCFIQRMTEHKKVASYLEAKQKETCRIVAEYPSRTLTALKLAGVVQTYPNAKIDVAKKLAEDLVHLHQDCCKGEVMECMIERLELTEYTCKHSEEISPQIGDLCCKKPLLERVSCLIHLVNEDTPKDLPPIEKEFIEDPKVCEHLVELKDQFLASFLYEFTRRNIDRSAIENVKTANKYSQKLPLCCKETDPHECLKNLQTELEKGVEHSKNLLKTNCDAQQLLGNYKFTLGLTLRYVPKMPAVSKETLVEITTGMASVGTKCCGHDEIHRMACADEFLSIIIGEMCARQKETFINQQVANCCNGHYTDRRQCFTELGPDPNYVPPEVNENTFQFEASLCTASPEELAKRKLGLFVTFLKLKPNLETEKVSQVSDAFIKMYEQCCAVEDKQACFDEEKPKLIDHCQQFIGH